MAFFLTATQFLTYRTRARRWDAFHSPYLFDLFSFACNDQVLFEAFEEIENQRSIFLRSKDLLPVVDFGAGSQLHKNEKNIAISTIAHTALSFPWQCRFMARLASKIKAESILELGTSLGIAGAYLAVGSPSGKVITAEGNTAIANKARGLFTDLGLNNISLVNEPFSDFLRGDALPEKLDLVFLDGHHQKTPLLSYYAMLRGNIHENSIVIVDDIHWSADMYDGWKALTDYDEVTQSVDCFQFGLLFFRKDFLSKEHHQIRLPLRSLLRR